MPHAAHVLSTPMQIRSVTALANLLDVLVDKSFYVALYVESGTVPSHESIEIRSRCY